MYLHHSNKLHKTLLEDLEDQTDMTDPSDPTDLTA